MAGPRPRPTEVKRLGGTLRKDRTNPNEPQPARGSVCAPDWLKGEARWAWQQLSEMLGEDGTNVLTQQDRHALMMLCDAYQEYRAARRQVDEEGLMIHQGKYLIKHPVIQVYQDAWRRVRLMLVEFGLTPAARSKTSSPPKQPTDPLGELLARRKAAHEVEADETESEN